MLTEEQLAIKLAPLQPPIATDRFNACWLLAIEERGIHPDDIFSQEQLDAWAAAQTKDRIKPEDYFSTEDLVEWARSNVEQYTDPDDLFHSLDLAKWAKDKGYTLDTADAKTPYPSWCKESE